MYTDVEQNEKKDAETHDPLSSSQIYKKINEITNKYNKKKNRKKEKSSEVIINLVGLS